MLQQSTNTLRRLAMLVLPVAALLAQSNTFDPAIFKAPPAMYRAESTQGEANGQPVTMVRLVLPSVASLFFIQE